MRTLSALALYKCSYFGRWCWQFSIRTTSCLRTMIKFMNISLKRESSWRGRRIRNKGQGHVATTVRKSMRFFPRHSLSFLKLFSSSYEIRNYIIFLISPIQFSCLVLTASFVREKKHRHRSETSTACHVARRGFTCSCGERCKQGFLGARMVSLSSEFWFFYLPSFVLFGLFIWDKGWS